MDLHVFRPSAFKAKSAEEATLDVTLEDIEGFDARRRDQQEVDALIQEIESGALGRSAREYTQAYMTETYLKHKENENATEQTRNEEEDQLRMPVSQVGYINLVNGKETEKTESIVSLNTSGPNNVDGTNKVHASKMFEAPLKDQVMGDLDVINGVRTPYADKDNRKGHDVQSFVAGAPLIVDKRLLVEKARNSIAEGRKILVGYLNRQITKTEVLSACQSYAM